MKRPWFQYPSFTNFDHFITNDFPTRLKKKIQMPHLVFSFLFWYLFLIILSIWQQYFLILKQCHFLLSHCMQYGYNYSKQFCFRTFTLVFKCHPTLQLNYISILCSHCSIFVRKSWMRHSETSDCQDNIEKKESYFWWMVPQGQR